MKSKMKRFIAGLSALATISSLFTGIYPVTASAADGYNYLALGDSISTGYGLADASTECFVPQLAEDIGYNFTNEAVDGNTAANLLTQLQGGTLDSAISEAELVTITCGGNDLMNPLYERIANAYNAANEDSPITAEDVTVILAGQHETLSKTALLTYALSAVEGFSDSDEFAASLADFETNMNSIIEYLFDKNYYLSIAIATQYNPYVAFKGVNLFGIDANLIYDEIDEGANKLNNTIMSICSNIGNYRLRYADVNYSFSSASDPASLCNAGMNGLDINLDFHPTAAGHAVIADEFYTCVKNIIPCAHVYYTNGVCDTCYSYEPALDTDGDGYYEIDNGGKFAWFGGQVSSTQPDAKGVLTADINMTLINYTPMGFTGVYNTSDASITKTGFTGVLDGQGHTISNLYVNGFDYSVRSVGLVGTLSGTIKNLHMDNYTFNKGNADCCAGSIAGQILTGGLIENCSVTNSEINGDSSVAGGIAGANYGGKIQNCFTFNTVVTGSERSASIVGDTIDDDGSTDRCGEVRNCYSNSQPVIGSQNSGGAYIALCYYKPDEQFASGEVTWLLNHETSEGDVVWGQKIGTEEYPVIGGDRVYYSYVNCSDTTKVYSNTEGSDSTIDHVYDSNGFCSGCGIYEPATDKDADGVYEIANAGQLYWFAERVNGGDVNANAILTADITVNETVPTSEGTGIAIPIGLKKWKSIGTYENMYAGTFDGQNHTISGLYDSGDKDVLGLFGYSAYGSSISNIKIENSRFAGKLYVGGICAYNNGQITDCKNAATVEGVEAVGGICGNNNGQITECENSASVTGSKEAGGICGFNGTDTNVERCENTGTITGENRTGGIVGGVLSVLENESYITDCKNSGDIKGIVCVGGIVGESSQSNVSTCLNLGTVTGTTDVGSIVGYSSSGIYYKCYYNAAGDSTNTDIDGITRVFLDEIKSGEVTYLLQDNRTENVWGQLIGIQNEPIIGNGFTVYYGYSQCDSTVKTYSNKVISDILPEHTYDANGFCTVCDAYEPAVLNDNSTADDTTDDFYEISNAGQLYWFADKVNNDYNNYKNANAKLTANIVVNEGVLNEDMTLSDDYDSFREWRPIGNSMVNDENFAFERKIYGGTFDGQGHTISGLYGYDNSIQDYIGLFGELSGTVKNLGVLDSYFTSQYIAGGICGVVDGGTIENCYTIVTTFSVNDAGGICAQLLSGSINNCYSAGMIEKMWSDAPQLAGAISYYIDGTVDNCFYLYDADIDTCIDFSSSAVEIEKFESGEIAYNLGDAFGQNIGTETFPVLGGAKVYRGYAACDDVDYVYANVELSETIPEHTYSENGFCTVCDAYEPAVYDEAYASYVVGNAGQLFWITQKVNSSTIFTKIKLTADITIDDREWVPIGSSTNPFNGLFDGFEHTISGIKCTDDNAEYVGLVGYAKGATICSVSIKDSSISGSLCAGSVCGYADNTIIHHCYNYSTIKSEGVAGGICGKIVGGTNVSYSYNYGIIEGGESAGGICGSISESTISKCYNTGNISGLSNVGGINGSNENETSYVENCYNTGSITSETDAVGGIVGYNAGSVKYCHNYDSISNAIGITTDNGITETCFSYIDCAEDFASGKIAYLLQLNQSGSVWCQNLGTDPYPVLETKPRVYERDAYKGCIDTTEHYIVYSNIENDEPIYGEHIFDDNGFCTVCDGYEPAVLNDNGTADDTTDDFYEIGNAGQLYWFSEYADSSAYANAKLIANIVVNEAVLNEDYTLAADPETLRSWSPIGLTYRGCFDGQGYTVSGLYYENTEPNISIAFMNAMDDATIKNLGIIDSYFVSAGDASGITSTSTDTNILNCWFDGYIRSDSDSLLSSAGGIASAMLQCTITNCYSHGKVEAKNDVGGIIGNMFNCNLTNCYSTADITSVNGNAGVICGYMSNGSNLINCIYSSEVSNAEALGGYGQTILL